MLLCKTGSQQTVFHCIYTYGGLLFIQVCSDATPMPCSSVQGKMQSPLFSVAPVETCSSYRCAVNQQQSTAARLRAKCSPHCSVLLCKTGTQQAVCHCSYTYGDLLCIQVCSDPATKHCSKVQGEMQSPLFSAALQNRVTAGSVSLQLHLRRFALHTGVQ